MAGIMNDVAALLGVELGELFKIKTNGNTQKCKYVFRENGLFTVIDREEYHSCYQLACLVTGEAEIIKLPWKPEDDETYHYWVNLNNVADYDEWSVQRTAWLGDAIDVARLAMGNCFQTEEKALANKGKVVKRYCDVMNRKG